MEKGSIFSYFQSQRQNTEKLIFIFLNKMSKYGDNVAVYIFLNKISKYEKMLQILVFLDKNRKSRENLTDFHISK